MGWYQHPDTISIAQAVGEANRSGNEPYSLGWLKAYRDCYAKSYPYPGLDEYLKGIDEKIEALSCPSVTVERLDAASESGDIDLDL